VKALITGGKGFVGRHLAESLVSSGHEVEALDVAGGPLDADYHECDILDFDRLVAFLRALKPDWVVHLAAWSSVGRSFMHPTKAFEINAQGTVNLLEAVRGLELNAKVLIVSSAEVYGAVETDGLTGEDNPVAPVSPYALGKACGELSSLYYGGIGGVDIIIARSFNHTGPGQTDVFALPSFARQIAEAEKGLAEPRLLVGNLDVVRDFTDVRDVVRAYHLLLEKEPPGALYNVCSGQGRRLSDLVDMLVSMSKVPVEIVVEENRRRAAEIPALIGDNSLLSRDMGWRPEIPIKKTLEDLLEYWRGRVGEGAAP
jgi:GDP-4-dehydro-6-deoxy-D-mannose reductase